MIPAPAIMPRSISRMEETPSSSTRQLSTSALSVNRSTTSSRSSAAPGVARTGSAPVLIEPLPGLHAEVSRGDQLAHPRVDIEAVAVGLLEVLRDVQDGVEAQDVAEDEGPNRGGRRVADDPVELLEVGPRLLLVAPQLGDAGIEDAVDHEARHFRAADRRLADRLREVDRRLYGLRRGLVAFDDLDQAHRGRRVEEVKSDHELRPHGGEPHLGDR